MTIRVARLLMGFMLAAGQALTAVAAGAGAGAEAAAGAATSPVFPETRTAASTPASARDLVGTTPSLSIDTLAHGRFELAGQRGQWVVLNFWATWCAPCIREIPELGELAQRPDVTVLGLAFEEIERADLEAFLREHPAHYAIAPVDVYDPPAGFPVPRGLPLTYLVDPQGVVAEVFLGPVTRAELETAIAKAAAADSSTGGPAASAGRGHDG
jgi:thiol-disulfide isomerase/thioredoxin